MTNGIPSTTGPDAGGKTPAALPFGHGQCPKGLGESRREDYPGDKGTPRCRKDSGARPAWPFAQRSDRKAARTSAVKISGVGCVIDVTRVSRAAHRGVRKSHGSCEAVSSG
jgi:hypothetical protein